MEFQVNDIVRYAATGVCEIVDITEMSIGKKKASYYVLQPVHKDALQVYVPTDSQTLLSKMQRVLSAEEILRLIHTMPKEDCVWIEDDQQRKTICQQILSGGDRGKLIGMIRALYLHQQNQQKNGKKLHQADERYLIEAQKLINDEFAYVLHLKPEEVTPFIIKELEEH